MCVFWADAVAYVEWLGKNTGKTYRLPSEAEWDYVARAGTGAARFWGDGRDDACRYANTGDQTLRAMLEVEASPRRFFGCRDGHAYTSPVDSFTGNPWGFHDMLGNVRQWMRDCVHQTCQGAPDDGRWWDAKEGGDRDQRVARGGSWSELPANVRATAHSFEPVGLRFTDMGFRVVQVDWGPAMRAWPMMLVSVLLAWPAGAQQPVAQRDCPTCPELLRVAAGSFVMGAPVGEEEREGVPLQFRGRSVPRHPVTLGSFRMGRTPVTRDELAAFVVATKRDMGGSCLGLGADGKFHDIPGRDWRNPGFAQTGGHPAVCVSWLDAVAYVGWLGSTTGKTYRLPSEAEWEYVARAGTQTARFWGDGRDGACRYANMSDQMLRTTLNFVNSFEQFLRCSDGHAYTSPVASFAANPWGFHDMLGNVWQWTADCRHQTYEDAPADGSAWGASDGGTCDRRIRRGGAWDSYPWIVRSADRGGEPVGSRSTKGGFRVVRAD